jgi:broad specificity phosphatase PhoE
VGRQGDFWGCRRESAAHSSQVSKRSRAASKGSWKTSRSCSLTQAQAVAAALRCLDIRIVVSSDLARASSTAEIIARVAGVEVSIEPALRERNIGLWTGLTSAEVESRWPGQQEMYRANPEIPFPNGEGAEALVRRAIPVLLNIAQQDPHDGVAVVVSHGGLIRCVRLALGGTDKPLPGLGGCWLEACDHGLRLVAATDIE